MVYSNLELERRDAIAVIRLNRPDRLNAFNAGLTLELADATSEVAQDHTIRVVILTGSGRGFSAGADLQDRSGNWQDTEEALMAGYRPSLVNIVDMPKPVIAAVNGPAAGVGAAFAMACDLCVMAEEAYIMLAFSNIALVPDGGANWLLTRAIGYRRAFQAAIEAEKISASKCLEYGLANKVVPAQDLMSESLSWAAALAERAPKALAGTKQLMRQSATASYQEIYQLEAVRQNGLIGTADNQEGVKAFIEKRKPVFKGQ